MSTDLVRPAEQAVVRRAVVEDDGPLAFMMDTARFEHLQRVAHAMSASVFLPEHLRGSRRGGEFVAYDSATVAANCFRVINQAMRWGVDPFAVADETFVLGGRLGYSGKLIAAIVNARAGLVGRLTYTYSGAGADRMVTVAGTFRSQTEPQTVTLTVREGIAASDRGKGPNPMWRSDPDQKLAYSAVVKWARRYCPEIILGVLTDDDVDRIAAREPEMPSAAADLNARLRAMTTEPVARVAELPEPPAVVDQDAHPLPPADEPQVTTTDAAEMDDAEKRRMSDLDAVEHEWVSAEPVLRRLVCEINKCGVADASRALAKYWKVTRRKAPDQSTPEERIALLEGIRNGKFNTKLACIMHDR